MRLLIWRALKCCKIMLFKSNDSSILFSSTVKQFTLFPVSAVISHSSQLAKIKPTEIAAAPDATHLTSSTRLFISLTSLWFSCSNWTQIGQRLLSVTSFYPKRWRAGGRTIWISSGESSSSTPPPSSHELLELSATSGTLFSAGNKTDLFFSFSFSTAQ